jgi:Transglycosylase-like domain
MRKQPRFAHALLAPLFTFGALSITSNSPAQAATSAPAGALPSTTSPTGAAASTSELLSPSVHLVARQRALPAKRRLRHRHRAPAVLHRLATVAYSPAGGVWQRLRMCESAGNYRENSGNGYFGAYQFSLSSWRAVGGLGEPDLASPAAQDAAAQRLESGHGWWAWPSCAYSLGLV